MPLTDFQKEVLSLLKEHRNPNSFVAGGIAIQRAPNSTRYSNDIDFFHDLDEAVQESAGQDVKTLEAHGFKIDRTLNQPSFVRASAEKKGETLKLEWVRDTAFRFFPVIADEELGFRLQDADLAVNKCLALANRSEVRDVLDLLELEKTTLSLTAACWAACGKDPGFTPGLLLDLMRRHSVIRPEKLEAENLVEKFDAPELKILWLEKLDKVEQELALLPPEDLGCLYLEQSGEPVQKFNPSKLELYLKHFGSVAGGWPRVR